MRSFILEVKKQIETQGFDKTKQEFVDKINARKDDGSFITLDNNMDKIDSTKQKNILFGIPYALKDNFCTQGVKTTSGSRFMEDFVPQYSSTVYSLLKAAGAICLGKTALDELGMGGTGTHCGFGPVINCLDATRTSGGSSSGSVNLVANKRVAFALGSDTGDSSRRPASFMGVVGFKPTYGAISRYGVTPYSPSLDHVGIITTCVADTAIVFDTLCQYDEKDATSQSYQTRDFFKELKPTNKAKLLIFKEVEAMINEEVRPFYQQSIKAIQKAGYEIVEKELPKNILLAITPIYKITTAVEGFSSWSNLTGLLFGKQDPNQDFYQQIIQGRSEYLGNEAKIRMVVGSWFAQKENFTNFFIPALKVKRKLVEYWNQCLLEADAILIPSSSSFAFKVDDIGKTPNSLVDDILTLANFAGTPSITIPYPTKGKPPWGINLNCSQFQEQKLFNIALFVEELFDQEGQNE